MASRSKTTPKSSKVPAKSVRSGRVEKSQSGSSKVTGLTKSSSAYAQDFEQHLIDVQIYPDDYYEDGHQKSRKAANHDEIKLRLKKPQEKFSAATFSEADFEKVRHMLNKPRSEVTLIEALISVLQLDSTIPREREQRFNNLEPLTEVMLTCASPDFYDGASAARIHPDVRKKLSGFIQPSTRPELPFVPNFFLEVKRLLGGDGGVLARQALHNGALGARAMHELRSFGIPDSDRTYCNADTITAAFIQGSSLKFYSMHYGAPDQDSGISDKYMYLLAGHSLDDSYESFLAGATAFCNAREWAKERRDNAIALANQRASEMAKNRASAAGG